MAGQADSPPEVQADREGFLPGCPYQCPVERLMEAADDQRPDYDPNPGLVPASVIEDVHPMHS